MLYFVSTPIGNLSDISDRALETLKSVDLIACEDTRQSIKILNKYEIKNKMISLHQHSSDAKLDYIVGELISGKSVAYISDSGTPNLSDPGAKLSEQAQQNSVKISPIPGPSTLMALISVAPFSCSDFRFIGFFPRKKGRETLAKELMQTKHPVFFFESPKRVRKTIKFLSERLNGKKLLIGRELTKIFEEIIVLDLSLVGDDNINKIPEKGEFVLAIFE